jgi:hypothetical protein
MRLQEATPRAGSSPAVLRPIPDGIGEFEPRHDVLADPVEQVFLVLDVVVERHRFDADLASDEVTLVVSSEVVNFYPTIATRLSRCPRVPALR